MVGHRVPLVMRLFDQAIDFIPAQMQALGLRVNHPALLLGDAAVGKHVIELVFQRLALDAQLIAERRRQNSRWNCEDADPQKRQHDGHGPTCRRDRRNIAIAHAGQGHHCPINRLRNVLELIGLRLMLKQIAQAGRQHHQQQHHKGRGGQHRPLAFDHDPQGLGRPRVARELKQPHQAEHPQEAQVDQVVQKHLQEKGQDRQQIDQGTDRLGIAQAPEHGLAKARFFHHRVHPHQIFHSEDRHRQRVQDDELQVQDILDRIDRLENHCQYRDHHPRHDASVDDLMELAAVGTGPDQGMDLLAHRAPLVQRAKLTNRGNRPLQQLEQPQQAQRPHSVTCATRTT